MNTTNNDDLEDMCMRDIIYHYDCLIDENNDPVKDSAPIQDYMSKWDGQVFINLLDLNTDKSVLEIGVGTGRLAIKTIPNCKHFTGVDISPKTIRRAEENLSAYKNKTLICIDFLAEDFADGFDVIYSSLTFLHIREKAKAIQKIAELLNENGKAVISIDKQTKGNELDFTNRKVKIYPDTVEEISLLMSNSGLFVIEVKEIEFASIIVAEKEKDHA